MPGIESEAVIAQERDVAAAVVAQGHLVKPVAGVGQLIVESGVVVGNLQVADLRGVSVSETLDIAQP